MKDLFSHTTNFNPKKGSLLLSEPFLNDDYFRRAVILLCEHNDEGSFGFILNNYVNIKLNELIEGVDDFDANISLGGPVSTNNLYYIHTLGEDIPGSTPLVKGVYIGGEFEVLKSLIKSKAITPNQIKFFLGYSGWSANQLDNEMKEESWIVTKSNLKIVMGKRDKDLWKKILNKMGGKFSVISNYPINPSLN
jgi:putative transcriptional regulator